MRSNERRKYSNSGTQTSIFKDRKYDVSFQLSTDSSHYRQLRTIQPCMKFGSASNDEMQRHYIKYNGSYENRQNQQSNSDSSYYVYEYEEEEEEVNPINTETKMRETINFSPIQQYNTSNITPDERYSIFQELRRIDITRRRLYLQVFFNLWKSRYKNPHFNVFLDPDYRKLFQIYHHLKK